MDDFRSRIAQFRSNSPQRPLREIPKDSGKRLKTIPRDDGEVAISWATTDAGHPYLNIRFWSKGSDGALFPDGKRGITIRVRELADLAEGVAAAMDEAEVYRAQKAASGQR